MRGFGSSFFVVRFVALYDEPYRLASRVLLYRSYPEHHLHRVGWGDYLALVIVFYVYA
jgi:hypothetical protein